MGNYNSGRRKRLDTTMREMESLQASIAFDQMLRFTKLPFCWACGRSSKDIPVGWYGPWLVERAHIIAGNRVRDIRAIVLLDSLCHRIQHGERIVLNGERVNLPKLRREHLLWIKFHRDRDHYDREFLASLTVSKSLPLMLKPPIAYIRSYEQRRGTTDAVPA